mmetsp:Transcript_7241/g.21872  ORF Transcript_7241/g.21872 Transcript_7241/m.21872 type:complete len:242 (-) Transcript_7241:8-733(-)
MCRQSSMPTSILMAVLISGTCAGLRTHSSSSAVCDMPYARCNVARSTYRTFTCMPAYDSCAISTPSKSKRSFAGRTSIPGPSSCRESARNGAGACPTTSASPSSSTLMPWCSTLRADFGVTISAPATRSSSPPPPPPPRNSGMPAVPLGTPGRRRLTVLRVSSPSSLNPRCTLPWKLPKKLCISARVLSVTSNLGASPFAQQPRVEPFARLGPSAPVRACARPRWWHALRRRRAVCPAASL